MERDPDVIYVPTPESVVDRMLELADVQPDDVVYDLGCGDGRIVVRAAEYYGVRAWGFDIDPERVAEARENVQAAGVEDLVTIEQADIFTLDLSPASVVTLYLLPELNERLIPQLAQLEPGSRVVSHDFDIAGVTPLQHETLDVSGDPEPHQIYLWHTPLEISEPTSVEPDASPAPTAPDGGGESESAEAGGDEEPQESPDETAEEDAATEPSQDPEIGDGELRDVE
jgi:SAM-dependent methyltransferase